MAAEHAGGGLGWLLFAGSSVHVTATGWLFFSRDVRAQARRHPLRYLVVPAGLVAMGGMLATGVPEQALSVLLLPFFGWQFWHYRRQNQGLVALAAAAQRIPGTTGSERRALLVTGWAGLVGVLSQPPLLQLKLPPTLTRLLQLGFPLAVAALVIGVVQGLTLLSRRPAQQRPMAFCAVYLMALGFFLPVFLFGSPYASVGVLVIAHGFQYLVLTGLVATGNRQGMARILLAVMMLCLAFGAGAALAAASHRHGTHLAERWLYGVYLGVVMTHFVMDAGIWRLRDPFCRRFISSRVPYLLPPLARPAADGSDTDIRSSA